VTRPLGLGAIVLGVAAGVAGGGGNDDQPTRRLARPTYYPAALVVGRALLVVAVFGVLLYGSYFLSVQLLMRSENKRRAYNTRNVLRLAFGFVGTVATLAVLTENWLGLLFSLSGHRVRDHLCTPAAAAAISHRAWCTSPLNSRTASATASGSTTRKAT